MAEVCRLVIAARLEDVRQACDAVVEAAESAGLDERAVYHCQMAVDESLTNIIEHGFEFETADHQIELVCQTDPDHFLIIILDDGPAFNPLEHEAPDPNSPLDAREPGGWGIYFIRRLMDDVQYERDGDRNKLVLVKRRPAAQPTAEDGFPVQVLDAQSAIITPSGRLDSSTSPQLQQTLTDQLGQGHTWLVVDMPLVEYIASSGLKVLVSAWRRARERDGDVVLSGLQPRIVEIFEMVGFDMLFEIHPDLATALAHRPASG